MGKGGGDSVKIPDDLVRAQTQLIDAQSHLGLQSGARENLQFQNAMQDALAVGRGEQALTDRLLQTRNALGGLTGSFLTEGEGRRRLEESLLAPHTRTAGQVATLGGDLGLSGQQSADAMRFLSPLFRSSPFMGEQNRLAGVALNRDLLNQQLGAGASLMGQAQGVSGLAEQTGADLFGLRGQTLDTLGQVARGEMPTAISDLFRPSAAAERDILERQFQNARGNLISRSGMAGGNLDRNLAALETNRALGIAQQEQARGDQERALAANLLGTATQQGITAPAQQAALLGQAGQLFGMGGQQFLGAEQARQSGLGLGANILSGIESQRQAGLSGALGALDLAANRDFQSLLGQQQALAQSQQMAQSLAGQFGQGGDQFRLAGADLLGRQPALAQQIALAPALSSQVLSGAPITPSSALLAGAAQGNQGLMDQFVNAQMANNQSRQQANAGVGSLVGTLGAAALIGFT